MERRAIAIQGTVQGVGFRPFVCTLASTLHLGGFVRNETGGVRIEVEGEAGSLDQFLSRLTTQPPPLARIDDWRCEQQDAAGERRFRIDPSRRDDGAPAVRLPSRPTRPPATTVWPNCSTPATAATAIRSSTAPTAGRG